MTYWYRRSIGEMDYKGSEGTRFVKVLQLISSHDLIRFFAYLNNASV